MVLRRGKKGGREGGREGGEGRGGKQASEQAGREDVVQTSPSGYTTWYWG